MTKVCKHTLIFTWLMVLTFVTAGILRAQDTFEVDDTFSEAKVINIHDSSLQHHTIHNELDVDWVKFFALAGKNYNINTRNLTPAMDAYIELYDDNGVIVGERHNTIGKTDYWENLNFECTAEGVYYVKIGHMAPVSGGVYEYDLAVFYSDLPTNPVVVSGAVKNNFNQMVTDSRIAMTSPDDRGSALSLPDGSFFAIVLPGMYTYTINAPGHYQRIISGVHVPSSPLTIILSRFNQTPVAVPDNFTVMRGATVTGNVLYNDSDGDADALTAVLDSDVVHGSLSLKGSGDFTYTHDGSKAETDRFTYHATDTVGNSSTVTVRFSLQKSVSFIMLLLNKKAVAP